MKRFFKKGDYYKLIKYSRPIIANHTQMRSDNFKGGAILTYEVVEVRYISLFNHDYALYHIPKIHKILRYKTFFNPTKKDWNRKAYVITKRYWGKKHHLLTALWLEVSSDFKDIFSVTLASLRKAPQCKNEELIKKLNAHTEAFILSNNQKQIK
jgi:hypothetical protein